ncbi:MAG TPA: hypothetical protein H9880_09400 [Candidatus Anaerobutyricum avicola]|nr:hypothetical protein [Candidatus Anaerobutyricum avicola]
MWKEKARDYRRFRLNKLNTPEFEHLKYLVFVVGSVAVMLCGWDCKSLNTAGWKTFFGISAFLISISTVFLKQHSVLDIIAAVPVCMAAYLVAYQNDRKKRKGKMSDETEHRNPQIKEKRYKGIKPSLKKTGRI